MMKVKELIYISIIILPTILVAQPEIPTQNEYFELIRNYGAEKGEDIFHQIREVYPDTVFFY